MLGTLRGHSQIRKIGTGRTRVHLGYLSSDEYWAAHNWVLKAQGLQQVAPSAHSSGLIARIKRWFGRSGDDVRTPAEQPSQTFFDVTANRRKVALARLGGDPALLNRLVEYERRRQPSADELNLLDAVIESLERDRR